MTIRTLGDFKPAINLTAYVDDMALVIGNVSIGADSSVWPMTVVRGDVNRIIIGERTNIQDGSILHVTHDSEYSPGGSPLIIGDDITIGHGVVLHACTLRNFCLIGIGSVILDKAVIGEKAMIGAGSLVPPGKELEGGWLWVGQPVIRKRELTEKELDYFEYSSRHYVSVKDMHMSNKRS